ENIRAPLTLARLPGEEEPAPGSMSLTSTVPCSVPSLFHSSYPVSGRKAVKKRVPLTLVRLEGQEEAAPGLVSLTSTVPASVPSLLQSEKSRSRSWTKNNVPFTAVNPLKRKGGGGCKLSPTTSTVPAAVPSLFQSLSLPKVEKGEKPEAKKSVPLTLVRSWAPRALTITVPAAVPSVRHSPALVPSLAVTKTVPPASTNGPGDEPAAELKESSMSLTRKA